MAKSALITGAAGQDGHYLIKLLSSKGYAVHAQSRQLHAGTKLSAATWHQGELTDLKFLSGLVDKGFDEIYNLAAVSSPALSWTIPYETTLVNAIVPQRICDLLVKANSSCRFFQASSSDIFGSAKHEALSETTACNPESPYAIAKYCAHRMVGVYRSRFNLHASCGILFNHESPHRPLSFVSQKIAHAAAAISLGINTTRELDERGEPIVSGGLLKLGNIDIRRDFGFAGDVADAMHMIVCNDLADDYVIGTGQAHSIADFCEAAFTRVGLRWRDHVISDQALVRQADANFTRADPTKLVNRFGWKPSVPFDELVRMMVEHRLNALKDL